MKRNISCWLEKQGELTFRSLSKAPLVSKVSFSCSSIVTAASLAKVTPIENGFPGLLQNASFLGKATEIEMGQKKWHMVSLVWPSKSSIDEYPIKILFEMVGALSFEWWALLLTLADEFL